MRYAVTIFVSAFLLFQVQPLIGKAILPWFGGTPAVWTTCLLFFQALLLAGYAYAHWIDGHFRLRYQGWIHLSVLVVSLIWLPIGLAAEWKPSGEESYPVWLILLLLTLAVGGPYTVLASTGPLMQSWFRSTDAGKSPYRLYALSNIGSLLALLSYPFVFEPLLPLSWQQYGWSGLYIVFLLGACVCAIGVVRHQQKLASAATDQSDSQSDKNDEPVGPPGIGDQVMWLLLALLNSALLAALTNQMSQDVAVVSFMWILPLALFLFSFILCFDSDHWYHRGIYGVALAITLFFATVALFMGPNLNVILMIGIYAATMFVCAMVCNGELVRLKPHHDYLTRFYLTISLGGVCGGAAVALLAPMLFVGYWEFHLSLLGVVIVYLVSLYRDAHSPLAAGRRLPVWGVLTLGLAAFAAALAVEASDFAELDLFETEDSKRLIAVKRNFFGVKRVKRSFDDGEEYYQLTHGAILHGEQWQAPGRAMEPTQYYENDSGVALGLNYHPRRLRNEPLQIGIVGLGTGTIATYCQPGDHLRYYEIDPQIKEFSIPSEGSEPLFTYLRDCKAHHGGSVEVVLGDARLSIDREVEEGQLPKFDVLAVDAFSSDAIPIHLLTKECVELYFERLAKDGVLCLHISNRFIDLKPVCAALAEELGYQVKLVNAEESSWMLLTNNTTFLSVPEVQQGIDQDWKPKDPLLWTDDYSNLMSVIRWPDRDDLEEIGEEVWEGLEDLVGSE